MEFSIPHQAPSAFGAPKSELSNYGIPDFDDLFKMMNVNADVYGGDNDDDDVAPVASSSAMPFGPAPSCSTTTGTASPGGLCHVTGDAVSSSPASSPAAWSSSPAPMSDPDACDAAFDPAALTVDELRDECRKRRLSAKGPKHDLCARILESISNGETSPRRLSNPSKKRKRPHTRKQPARSDYASEAEYEAAWERWRLVRDSNNDSVHKSRDRERRIREQQKEQTRQLERENSMLESQYASLRDVVQFMSRAIRDPFSLTMPDRERLRQFVMDDPYLC
eukprot:m.285296 g.285296  ORF g.285296 m.285296 type:complete len:279 (+) comp11354_c0_seq1:1062-1898(+)